MKKNKNKIKNKHELVMIIDGFVVLAGLILAIVGFAKSISGLTAAGIIILIVSLIVFWIAYKKSLKVCSACGAKLNNCDYSYQLVSKNVSESSSSQRPMIEYVYEITPVCPKCGESKSYQKKFKSATNENIDQKVHAYCRERYGH